MIYVSLTIVFVVFFFFKQKTAYEMRISDWSSDVCSSDLVEPLDRLLSGDDLVIAVAPAQAQQIVAQRLRQVAHVAIGLDAERAVEIGRASCRERVCQYV